MSYHYHHTLDYIHQQRHQKKKDPRLCLKVYWASTYLHLVANMFYIMFGCLNFFLAPNLAGRLVITPLQLPMTRPLGTYCLESPLITRATCSAAASPNHQQGLYLSILIVLKVRYFRLSFLS